MELVPAARRHLQADLTLRGYVSDRVHAWRLHDRVDPYGRRALVVRTAGGWSQPELRSKAEFPLLYIDCWADHTRNPGGDKQAEDNVTNGWAVYRAVDHLLQGVREQRWGPIGTNPGLTIVSCERWTEPVPQTAGDAHGDARSSMSLPYPVPVGEAAVVTVAYAIHTHH